MMRQSLKNFTHIFFESFHEIRSNPNLFAVYLIGLFLVSVLSNGIDYYLGQTDLFVKIIGKVLFAMIPILILAKIIYVMKIRISGLGEYSQVLTSFLLYNFLYLLLVVLMLSLYIVPSMVLMYSTQKNQAFLWTIILLVPFLYALIFFSLAPFIGAFEETGPVLTFKRSVLLTKRDIVFVVVNHFFALLPHLCTPLIASIKDHSFKLPAIVIFGSFESLFSLIMTITTVKVYYHLLNQDDDT